MMPRQAEGEEGRPAGGHGQVLGPDQADGEGDQGVDIVRMRTDDAGDRQGQGDGVADGEAGDHEDQVAQLARDHHHAQQEGHVIDPGEDVHDPHADEFEDAGRLQLALLAAGDLHLLAVVGDQLLDEIAGGDVLDLGEVGVAGDEVEEGGGVDLQVLVGRAFEGEVEAAEFRRGGQGDDGRDQRAADLAGDGIDAVGQVFLDHRIIDLGAVGVEALALDLGDGHDQIDIAAVDLPDRVGFAAHVGVG